MDASGIRALLGASLALKQRFFGETAELLVEIGHRMAECLRGGGKVIAFGNGGSAADAQHLACELVGRFTRRDRPGLAAMALTSDSSVMTALGNDFGFEEVFRRQVEAHGRPGDVAVGITTSGRSANVVEALRLAREMGLLTVGLTGGGGGRLGGLVHYLIDVPHDDTPRVQEVHTMVVHILCQVIEEALPPAAGRR